MRDDIGNRGEALFFVLMTDFFGRRNPLFRPHFLGEKFPVVDYLVELVGAERGHPFFFAQVKTTMRGHTRRGEERLRIRIPESDIRALLRFPAPTYVIGIDEQARRGYLVSVNEGDPGPMNGVSTRYALNRDNLERLWQEVFAFWDGRDMVLKDSVFALGR